MTQHSERPDFFSTRHARMDAEYERELREEAEKEPPRIGRRESEPHSAEVSFLFDVLSSNFPNHRAIWDLHHYFSIEGEQVDLQFDISLFLNFMINEDLPSYKASEFGNRIPDLVINILSKSTWRKDLSEIQESCKRLKIPVFVLFLPYPFATKVLNYPFLRVYILNDMDMYIPQEINRYMFDGDKIADNQARIKLPERIPFDLAIKKLKRTYLGFKPRFRLVLLKKETNEMYLSKFELEKKRADEEKRRADEEKRRADEEKRRADELEKKLQKLKSLHNPS
ncbi:MAG: hypothetical protein K9W44_10675 [Candidatus Lokiarchaeota archaeon]|nr:hypothetical protein [Candidatus Harpocratesius repetitus]